MNKAIIGEFIDAMDGFMCFVEVARHSLSFNGIPIFKLQVSYSFRFICSFTVKTHTHIYIYVQYVKMKFNKKMNTGNMLFKQTEY